MVIFQHILNGNKKMILNELYANSNLLQEPLNLGQKLKLK